MIMLIYLPVKQRVKQHLNGRLGGSCLLSVAGMPPSKFSALHSVVQPIRLGIVTCREEDRT